MVYYKFVDVPPELIPTNEDEGKFVEVAGSEKGDIFKLAEVKKDYVIVYDKCFATRIFIPEAVILHRNESIRDSGTRMADSYYKAVDKINRRARKKR
jgi:hypothetical protein